MPASLRPIRLPHQLSQQQLLQLPLKRTHEAAPTDASNDEAAAQTDASPKQAPSRKPSLQIHTPSSEAALKASLEAALNAALEAAPSIPRSRRTKRSFTQQAPSSNTVTANPVEQSKPRSSSQRSSRSSSLDTHEAAHTDASLKPSAENRHCEPPRRSKASLEAALNAALEAAPSKPRSRRTQKLLPTNKPPAESRHCKESRSALVRYLNEGYHHTKRTQTFFQFVTRQAQNAPADDHTPFVPRFGRAPTAPRDNNNSTTTTAASRA
ncbi:hypothetical protein OCS_06149 [Ophiocordyceps sinensis CO18]|uniref:Uncharacterized protein n=1 Tax=Ophiocordyceps sinensis (strain Co18 / CGMCC 3.14243) TaxID=911162 RepID=T5A6E5_OPHSC|nr:hypothetical protein OCS_06149 [Ophiocordyceps sinensis CO18]